MSDQRFIGTKAATSHRWPGSFPRWLRIAHRFMVITGILCIVVPIAVSDELDLDDFIDALNELIATKGPVPGRVAEDLPDNLVPAEENSFAFEGGPTGTAADAEENTNLMNFRAPVADPNLGPKFDIPTGAKPSPLLGATEFTHPMPRFEELVPQPLPAEGDVVAGDPFPQPTDARSSPIGQDLENFLAQGIYPFPQRTANVTDFNPWQPAVEGFLGRPLDTPPAEGRPPGEEWAHQRWTEFFPEEYVVTAQAGARSNGGFRDRQQLHGYSVGEFAPGGLYHNTDGRAGFDGTVKGIEVRFHPALPVQEPNVMWTFDGTLPPKLLMARVGETLLLRHYNALPIDPAANFGFGLHTITTHEHNGHTPAESDGYVQAFFFPGQFYDYRWPLALAGHDSINTLGTDDRAGAPDGMGGIRRTPGDWRETMSTHWFHDHMSDFTAQNVYKGNSAAMNYYSSLDRGNEEIDDGVNLRLPSGTDLDWGNRDYDINLLIADKAWDEDGQLFYNIFDTDGFLGDRILTNWAWNPYFDVRARRYRLRLLNGAVARYFRVALVTGRGEPVPVYMIANDGNIMEHSVYFPHGILPTQAIGERYDIIVDFSQYAPGTQIYMLNLIEHRNGKRPHEAIPRSEVFSGHYESLIVGDRWIEGDPCVGKFLQFRVQEYNGNDLSMDPAEYVSELPNGQPGKKMIPLPEITQEELDNAVHRQFVFGRSSGTDEEPWTIKTDGGSGFTKDARRLSAAPAIGALEIWHLENGGGGWSHPIHIHFEEAQILERDGRAPPEWEKWARKDMFRVGRMGDSGDKVKVAIRFREFMGSYMEHCHNTTHEDRAMLLRWDLESPGQVRVMPTPMPTWDGVGYVPSYALPTFRSGGDPAEFEEPSLPDAFFNRTCEVLARFEPVVENLSTPGTPRLDIIIPRVPLSLFDHTESVFPAARGSTVEQKVDNVRITFVTQSTVGVAGRFKAKIVPSTGLGSNPDNVDVRWSLLGAHLMPLVDGLTTVIFSVDACGKFGSLELDGDSSINDAQGVVLNSVSRPVAEEEPLPSEEEPPTESPKEQPLSFLRGDCNADHALNVSDVLCSLNWLFSDGRTDCIAALNINGDLRVNIADPVALLSYLFTGGDAPAAPFPACGPTPTQTDTKLGCATPLSDCN